ncbi:MAG: SpoIIE family protein phosphatase [Thermoanaerobaculia bacterium]|nr:SpoIIE family protein phosphatase [Thermoanaerobaculia bacterium]MBP9825289.1 SpoIIE family protein phosphatase [Thermoanaerobaculia bacterium]
MNAGGPTSTAANRRALDDLEEALLALARREPQGRQLTEQLLALLDRATGSGGAALYLKSDRGFRREIATPGSAHEELLTVAPVDGPGQLTFCGGLVRWNGATVEPGVATPALLLALVTAARELVLRGQLKRQDFEAKSRGVQLEALYDVGLAIASTLDFERLCEEILMRAVSLSDARRGALYLMQSGRFDLHRVFGGDAQARLDPQEDETRELLAGVSRPTCCVLPGALHVLGVPIAVDGLPKGLLVIGDKESRQGVGPFSPADRRTLDLLANQAAIALENADLHRQALEKERLEREIELASEIQRQILPKGTPEIAGYELAGWNRPAKHIGGDYYDFFPFDKGRSWGLVLGDVSGKGVPAALLVSTLHSALRLLLDRLELGSDLFSRLNDHILASSAANKFITLLAARLDTATGVLHYLNAGHNPGIIVHCRGGVEQMGPGGLPLGLLPGVSCRTEQATIEPGDLLCFYSDGITEAVGPDDVEFGFDRLADLLADACEAPLGDIIRRIDLEVSAHAGTLPQGDDQTVLLLRRSALTS